MSSRSCFFLIVAFPLLSTGCPEVDVASEDSGSDGSDAPDGDADVDADGDGDLDLDWDGPYEEVLVYAHSRDRLYSFSAETNTVTDIGPFLLEDGAAAPYMLDLAVNEAGEMYTTSYTALYRVEPETARVAHVGEFQLGEEQLFALTFLPAGVLLPEMETLVGATNEGAYYSVDPETARTRYVGRYPSPWISSGDIVSVIGLGTFATVKRADASPEEPDVLVEMHFAADGASTVEVLGPVVEDGRAYRQIFGVGYWGRALYGFTNAGELVEIDRATGAGRLVSDTTGTDHFWGAGVTTRAPVVY